jgi:hypothetical protein
MDDEEDATSLARPRKHPEILKGTITVPKTGLGRSLKSAGALDNARVATDSSDVFDVPSEDEFEFRATTPARRPIVQRSKTEGGLRANKSNKDIALPNRPVATTHQPQKFGATKSFETAKRTIVQEPVRPQQPAQTLSASRTVHTEREPQSKRLQTSEETKRAGTGEQRSQRSNTTSKNSSRAASPGLSARPAPIVRPTTKPTATERSKKVSKPRNKHLADLDMFDLPSSDEETRLPNSQASKQSSQQASKSTAKQLVTSRVSSLNVPQKIPAKSRELGNLQNRKRKGSVSSVTASKPAAERTFSVAQRDRKYPKKEKGTSPGHERTKSVTSRPAPPAATVESMISKPRRARTQTVPVLSQPVMSKGQSSPARLHKMVPLDQADSEPTSTDTLASDDTMYEIPDSVATPVRTTPLRKSTSSTPGSVTPRQKDLFSTLLGAPTAPKTPASALASLQLTDKKPRSLLGALARSKSDLTYSSQARKTRLIDTLRHDETSSGDDESEGDEDFDDTIIVDQSRAEDRGQVQAKPAMDDVNMEEATAADSQTSQGPSGAGTRPRLTYAAQRSYLQEENPEDEFLMSMDLEDGWKLDSQTVSTDDEDAPTSQVRTHHELKKYGQNTMFSWDMEESIREISVESRASMRRSAMIELCTKMHDSSFVSQLLDSGFTHKLFESTASTGDLVFDFAAVVSVLFILQTRPTYAVVDQMLRSNMMATLVQLVDKEVDISRTARDRKSNMSKIAQESLSAFRALVQKSRVWSPVRLETVSPQLVALKTLELLILSLRESGNMEPLLSPAAVSTLVNICLNASARIKAGQASPQDATILNQAFSILESVSVADQDYSTWSTTLLEHLAEIMPVFFEADGSTNTAEAIKLCMNLTNNKPKACQPFSTKEFVQPLIRFIVGRFDLLDSDGLGAEPRKEALETLTLSLGAMINLAELNNQARLNTIDDRNSVERLVKTFLVGSKRAAQVLDPIQSIKEAMLTSS